MQAGDEWLPTPQRHKRFYRLVTTNVFTRDLLDVLSRLNIILWVNFDIDMAAVHSFPVVRTLACRLPCPAVPCGACSALYVQRLPLGILLVLYQC